MLERPAPRNTKKSKPGIYFKIHSFKLLVGKVRKSYDDKLVLIK